MNRHTPIKTILVIMLCVFAVVPQTWKDDSLVVRQILDTNGLYSVTVNDVALIKDSIGVRYLRFQDFPEFDILPALIGKLNKLRKIELKKTNIITLPPEIGELKLLNDLTIGSNKISILPPEIGSISLLNTINIDHETGLQTLPPEIGNLSSLEILRVTYSNLSKLPDEICNLGSLKVLTLYKNQLTEIPQNIGNLSSLEGVDLYYNKLKSLPNSILNLPLAPDHFAVCFNDSLVFTPEQCSYFMIKDYTDYFRNYCPVEIEDDQTLKPSNGILSNIVFKANNIHFTLRRISYLHCRLYDMRGRVIAHAFSGELKEGSHSIAFSTGRCGAGMFYVVIQAGQECYKKAIVMMK